MPLITTAPTPQALIDGSETTLHSHAVGGSGNDRARAFVGTENSISNNTLTVVDFDSESYDPGTDFASDVYTIPTTGRYLINVSPSCAGMSNTIEYQAIIHDGTSQIAKTRIQPQGVAQNLSVTAVLDLSATDTIDIRVFEASGGDGFTIAVGTNESWVEFIRLV